MEMESIKANKLKKLFANNQHLYAWVLLIAMIVQICPAKALTPYTDLPIQYYEPQ